MTTVDGRARAGWLAYWLLPPAERRAVRRIERTSRAAGEPRLDAIALGRLQRTARRARLLGPVGRTLDRTLDRNGLDAQIRLARLCSTMRHPSRTGVCAGAGPRSSRPLTS
jgi:hypothetical protein